MLSTMAGDQVLEIVGRRDALRLACSQEVVLDRVCVVAERDLNRALKSMEFAVVAGTLKMSVNFNFGMEL